ncbi:MAG: hypothetical protein G01um10147_143 [Microgenomates group bacterium Gr01-1014_7]|nr:MAG: hypothetical protein G01um10147_143 [Microgenomates group bacterium Gr01-1014_7]
MLNRRTNFLLNKDVLDKLVKLSRTRNISMAEVVRRAVEKEYEEEKELETRKKAIDATLMGRLMSKGKIDYKELINYGRKY